MNSADRERVKELLARAARVAPPDRVDFIRKATGDDAQIAAEVIDLLATLDDPQFMSSPTRAGIVAALPDSTLTSEKPGTLIGRYKLLQLIGEGGFGSVFLAEQTEPVQRRVALKIIKAGMDTKQVIARFEAERQAVALMDHPSIARVLDAGATAAGRPYFVMELVRGEPITRYCDRQRLPVRQRLTLFQDVCNAVQHAHQKGVIHRDLKPSNVLVTVADGEPLPKVIDFGIAKATSSRLTDKTLFTELHQLIGTPEYMSPEQADLSGLDVDTRSDVYSLGVLLYELLSGTTPIERGRLRSNPLAEIQRMIREEEPARPSLRLAHLASSAMDPLQGTSHADRNAADSSVIEIARGRGSDPSNLVKSLRGDLDWIVMKCLEKDRRRRYPTASALAEDVARFLLDQPVQATPPGRLYTLRKFVRRNHRTVFAVVAMTLTLIVAAGISLQFGLSEARHRAAAELALDRTAKAEAEAKSRADELAKVAKFQEQQLSGIDVPAMGTKLRAAMIADTKAAWQRMKLPDEVIDEKTLELERLLSGNDFTNLALSSLQDNFFQPTLSAINMQFADQPLVKARLLETSANTLQSLGLFYAATAPQTEALAIRRNELGDEHPDTLLSISNLGFLLQSQGKFEESERYTRDALETQRRVLGADHPETLSSISNLGLLMQAQGKLAEAELYNREALDNRRKVLGEQHPDTLASMNNMGFLLQAQGKLSEAEPYFVEALENLRQIHGNENLDTLVAINNMGGLRYAQGRLSDAEPYFREGLQISREVLGTEHHNTLRALDNLAVLLRALGRMEEAELHCRESMEKHRHALGNEHPDTLISIGNMGVLALALGKTSEAEPFLLEALDGSLRTIGDRHPDTLRAMYNWGNFLLSTGRLSEAEQSLRDALDRRRLLLGDQHPDTLIAISTLGYLMLTQGNLQDAELYCREALEKQRNILGTEHPNTLVSMTIMGSLLYAQGRFAEAIQLLSPAEPAVRQSFTGGNAVRLGRFLTALGCARAGAHEFAAAEIVLSEAQTLIGHAEGSMNRDHTEVLSCLVKLYEAWHAADSTMGYDRQADQWRLAETKANSGS